MNKKYTDPRGPAMLARYGITANRRLGQNFLVDGEILARIADALPRDNGRLIEVGPGYGALTEHLVAQPRHSLTLVEQDPRMVEILARRCREDFAGGTTIDIHAGDVLEYTPPHEDYVLIGNIPYYITSPILTHFLSRVPHAPRVMVLLVQEEVADKVTEQDGKHSYLSLTVGSHCTRVEKLFSVPRGAFYPVP